MEQQQWRTGRLQSKKTIQSKNGYEGREKKGKRMGSEGRGRDRRGGPGFQIFWPRTVRVIKTRYSASRGAA